MICQTGRSLGKNCVLAPYWAALSARAHVWHVDGHEDGSPPQVLTGTLQAAMGANDVFMLGTGLLGKVREGAFPPSGSQTFLSPEKKTKRSNSAD